MMQVSSRARRFPRGIPIFLRPHLSLTFDPVHALHDLTHSEQWTRHRSYSFQTPRPFVTIHWNPQPSTTMFQQLGHHPRCSPMVRACFSSEANKMSGQPTDTVEELYQKMNKSVEARTMPPNAWLWSLIRDSANQEDIKLLFQMLKKLRIFRLSNLRIHANFNCHLCMRVTEACARAGALDYGLKALWKHNVYGLTPTIGSAHYLLLYAKEHNNDKLMVKIMNVLQKNSLPLQPGTADIVFRSISLSLLGPLVFAAHDQTICGSFIILSSAVPILRPLIIYSSLAKSQEWQKFLGSCTIYLFLLPSFFSPGCHRYQILLINSFLKSY